MNASKLQPAFLGGLLMGVLSALPVISIGNCCCCLWVVSGGLLAAYLLQQRQAAAIDVSDGAIVGLLAGLIGAVVATIISVPMSVLTGPYQTQLLERLLQNVPNVPDEVRDAIQQSPYADMGTSALGAMLGFVVMLVVGAIFSTIGGMLGAVLVRRNRSQAVAPPA